MNTKLEKIHRTMFVLINVKKLKKNMPQIFSYL